MKSLFSRPMIFRLFLTNVPAGCTIYPRTFMKAQETRQGTTIKIESAFFICAAVLFVMDYCGKNGIETIPLAFESDAEKNRAIFLVNFFIPFAVAYLCLVLSATSGRQLAKLLAWITSASAVSIAVYTVPDTLPLKLLAFLPYCIAAGATANTAELIFKAFSAAAFFATALLHPAFLGEGNINLSQFNPTGSESLALSFLCAGAFLAASALTRLSIAKDALASTLDHMRTTENQLLVINRKLSENTRHREEAAMKSERLRITRDMHDSLGYIFTNMIALSDAATSSPDVAAGFSNVGRILRIIRNQAVDGLRHTREALHLIREIQDHNDPVIQSIYQMKSIFEEVTEITIDIETGNMRAHQPRRINTVLRKIIQEALTNSLRHGHATKIVIQFWEFKEELKMTVSDNGSGAKVIVKGIGLQGMEERLRRIGGRLEFSSPEEGGFRLSVAIPTAGVAAEEAESAGREPAGSGTGFDGARMQGGGDEDNIG